MALTNAYVQGYGKMAELFQKLRDGQAPDQFTHQLLKDWGFTSTNDRQFIPLLKALGFLAPDGKPTSRYQDYRDHSRSKTVMGEALKNTYGDIFLIKSSPTKDDKDAIQGKFKSFHNVGDRLAQLMTSTFLALLELADISTKDKGIIRETEEKEKEKHTEEKDSNQDKRQPHHPPSLHYNIQIHLPATKDIEVYNAIFKSLKDHLYEA